MSIASTVARWLLRRPPNNSADLNPGILPQELNIPGTSSMGAQPIEISAEEDVWTILRDTDCDPDFFSMIECTLFSALARNNTMKSKRTS